MRNALLGACLAIFVATTAAAQAPVGTISGTVRDQTDAVRSRGHDHHPPLGRHGVERHLTSGTDGAFAAPALAAGESSITVELTGFRRLQRAVTVATGRVPTVDLHMEIGQASEVVDVAAAAVHVDVETHAISGLITRQKIQELPINGRSFLQLAFLEPGVSASPGSTSQVQLALFGVDSRRRLQQDGHHGRWRQRPQLDRGQYGNELLAGGHPGVPAVVGELRSLDRHHQRRRGQHRDAQRRQRPARLRLFLLSRSRHGGVPGAATRPVEPGSVSSRAAIPASGSAARSKRIGSSTSAITSTPARKASWRFSRTWHPRAASPAHSRIPTTDTCSARASTGKRTRITPRLFASRTIRTAGSGRAATPSCRRTGCATSTSRTRLSSASRPSSRRRS